MTSGLLEATRASEAVKVAFRSNMHMDSRVFEVAGFKYEAIFIALLLATLYGHCPLVSKLQGCNTPQNVAHVMLCKIINLSLL